MSPNDNVSPNIRMIPIEKLHPNSYNPNRQTDEEFEENVAEVRRRGIPKPIIVRPAESDFEIVDGEHAWRAAKHVGLKRVPCEIINVDDFESRRQTYKRNRAGQDNPVLLGRMFQGMAKARGLSIRGLAREIDVPESTIRAAIKYSEGAEVRSACADADPVEEIGGLTNHQVQMYLDLPRGVRDVWLDAGAALGHVERLYSAHVDQIAKPLKASGLGYIVEPLTFRQSLEFAVSLALWQWEHDKLKDVAAYVRAVADLRIGENRQFPPIDVLELLPCKLNNRSPEALLSPKSWAKILTNAAARASSPKALLPLVESGVRTALRKAKVDLAEACGPEVAEAVQIVENGPECVRKADFFSLAEQVRLVQLTADAPDDAVQRAKRMTCEHFRRLRQARKGKARRESGTPGRSVEQVFYAAVETVLRDQRLAAEEDLFADRDRLLQTVVDKLVTCEAINKAVVGDRPAREVLAERIEALEPAEFALLAAAVLSCKSVDSAGHHWVKALKTSLSGKR